MVQIDEPKGHVLIKFRDNERLQDMPYSTGEQVECRHTNGEISNVRINTRVRIASLPPEVSDALLQTVLFRYRKLKDIQAETWSRLYRSSVANGIDSR